MSFQLMQVRQEPLRQRMLGPAFRSPATTALPELMLVIIQLANLHLLPTLRPLT